MTPDERKEIEAAIERYAMQSPSSVSDCQAVGEAWDRNKSWPHGCWWVKALTGDWSDYVGPGGVVQYGAHWFDTESEAIAAANAYAEKNPQEIVRAFRALLAALDDAEKRERERIVGLVSLLLEYGDGIKSLSLLPNGNSNHGGCCTCGRCRNYHDECVCTNNEFVAKLRALIGDELADQIEKERRSIIA